MSRDVEAIRNGVSVTVNMERLYMDNLPLIKKLIKPYTNYEPEEDLLQEAYFGLCEAVQHYETSENVRFMTYAGYWIRQYVLRYVENCGSVIRLPANIRQKISHYKKNVQEYQQTYGRMPTDQEMAEFMHVSLQEVLKICLYASGIQSLDTPIQDGDVEICFFDALESDLSPENETVDKYMTNTKKMNYGAL